MFCSPNMFGVKLRPNHKIQIFSPCKTQKKCFKKIKKHESKKKKKKKKKKLFYKKIKKKPQKKKKFLFVIG